MTISYYRLTVGGCALSWFLLGLHFPVLHEMTNHGRRPGGVVLTATLLVGILAVAALWTLLRTQAPSARSSNDNAPAT